MLIHMKIKTEEVRNPGFFTLQGMTLDNAAVAADFSFTFVFAFSFLFWNICEISFAYLRYSSNFPFDFNEMHDFTLCSISVGRGA